MSAPRSFARVAVVLCGLVAVAACSSDPNPVAGSNANAATVVGASSQYAQKCAPTNTDARDATGGLLAGYASGSLASEQSFVRAYMNEVYLWYREIPAVDASRAEFNSGTVYASLSNYFEALKTPARTASGKLKDEFSFTYPTAAWTQLSQSGVVYGYGVDWKIGSPTAPRNIQVAYVTPGTQADTLGLARGDRLLAATVDGVTVSADATDSAGIDRLNTALFPDQIGKSVVLQVQTLVGATRSVTVSSTQVSTQPVLRADVLTVGASKLGYLLFNDFILPGEGQLKGAFESFAAQGVSDLVLDLRYNGGGYLYMASQLAYMIAGPARTANKVFEKTTFNDKRTAETNSPDNTEPFYDAASGIAGTGTVANAPLPTLNLPRVFVLTTGGTCSASESVINGLRGVDVQVIVIGGATCGKPYGFVAKDNCGISYFPIEFQGVNAKGFGDFADGFQPTCAVADDLTRALGDVNEAQFAAALGYRATGLCPAGAAGGGLSTKAAGAAASADGTVYRIAPRLNKYLLP
ncbi:MAG: S41 family peptidase [Lautropia sp.]